MPLIATRKCFTRAPINESSTAPFSLSNSIAQLRSTKSPYSLHGSVRFFGTSDYQFLDEQ